MGYFHFFSQNCLRQGNRTKNTYGGTQNSNPTQKEYSNGQVNLLRNFLQLLSCVRRVFCPSVTSQIWRRIQETEIWWQWECYSSSINCSTIRWPADQLDSLDPSLDENGLFITNAPSLLGSSSDDRKFC